MKKYLFTVIFSLILSTCYSQQDTNYYDITSPFKLWLLRNEAKAMSNLGCDSMIIEKSSTPFSILVPVKSMPQKAEEDLWSIHRNIYSFLNEAQKIYDLAKQFGNGKLAIMIKKARPEVWIYSGFFISGFSIPQTVIRETRKSFLNSLFIAIGLNPKRDADLSNRLKIAIRSLKDEEFRLMKEYISAFKALYPTERSIANLEQFIEQGPRKPFATGLTEIINSVQEYSIEQKINVVSESSHEEEEDPLAELESLSDSSVEEESKPLAEMEQPNPEEPNIYDIW